MNKRPKEISGRECLLYECGEHPHVLGQSGGQRRGLDLFLAAAHELADAVKLLILACEHLLRLLGVRGMDPILNRNYTGICARLQVKIV